MVHAKLAVFDENLAVVGSANLDVRSFFLNYELSVAVHDAGTIKQLSDWFESLSAECEQGMNGYSWWRSGIGTFVRIFASEL
jgi:cardiolipin synthase